MREKLKHFKDEVLEDVNLNFFLIIMFLSEVKFIIKVFFYYNCKS